MKKINILIFIMLIFAFILTGCSGSKASGVTEGVKVNKEDLKKIEIPILDKSIQDRVSNKLRKTFELRQKSKDLLEIAKKAIQIAIEKNEDEAIKYINQSK